MAELLGEEQQKIHPKLRMIANGSTEINSIRAEQCGLITVEPLSPLQDVSTVRGEVPISLNLEEFSVPPPRPKLKQLAEGVLVNVFIETQSDENDLPTQIKGTSRRGNLVAATIRLEDLPKLAEDSKVLSIVPGDTLASPTPEISLANVQPPDSARWQFNSPINHRNGKGILIGIIDVQGFDFAHPDFMVGNETRFVRIWDQGGQARPSPHQQNHLIYGPQFDFGAEFHQDHLNAAIGASKTLNLPPQEIERQSQMSSSSHGTHVASIAAGNLGICRKAMIAGVLIALPEEDVDRRKSFYDSTRIAHAVDYLMTLGDELGVPVSINISLGTNGHAHDGTGAISRWIDAALASPGRSVCVAAGNAGQEVAAFPGDIGFVMGRIHTSGKVPDRFLHQDIEWSIVGNGRIDVSENEFEIWYSEQDRFAISVRPPTPGADWIGPVEPQQFIENRALPDGSFISIYNELYHPSNGSNYMTVYLSPLFNQEAVVGIPSGTWLVRIHGRDVRDGQYHGWIERDDPRRLGRVGPQEAWRFPSFFSETSNVDNSSVSSLACGRRVISVANLHEIEERINITSSQGPTRDNRNKPDVSAPGTKIIAANGFSVVDQPWVEMTGTSMASPYVAGIIGLMLAVEPKLTAAQIEGILHRTSRPLPGKPFAWVNNMGFGRINPSACLEEASIINKRIPLQS
jgi:subtilisin family serine protease